MRRGLTALILVLATQAVVANHAWAVDPGRSCHVGFSRWAASSCLKSLGWQYDATSASFVRPSRILDDSAPVQSVRYELQERCLSDADCGSAHTCAVNDGVEGRRYRSLVFLVGSDGADVGAPNVRLVCVYSGRAVPLAAVESVARDKIQKKLPQPFVTSAPPGQSLVNLFTIFSAASAPEQAIAITDPVPGEVRAVPEYSWDFGDGLTGRGPGTPFDPDVLPSRNRGYYLGATYTNPGTKHVTVTVTWRVTFRLEGVIDVPLAPIVMTGSEDKVVATARGVLVR